MKGWISARKMKIKEFGGTLAFCLKLSWEASRLYTIMRVVCKIALPLLLITDSFLGKYIINLFSGEWAVPDSHKMFLLLLAAIFTMKVLQDASQKIEQYMQVAHDEMIEQKLSLAIMECAEQVDLQYFDDTQYYDKLQAASQNAYSMIQVIWNTLAFLGETISFVSVMAILWAAQPLCGLLLFFAAIPNAVISVKYTKSLYSLDVEQLTAERKKAYYRGIFLEKKYAQEMRLYHMGNFLKEKYTRIWKLFYHKKKKVIRRRTLLSIALFCLPEVVCAGIEINIGFLILGGQATVGDYSLYTGLVSQFLMGFYGLTLAFSEIYDNKLKISNLKNIFSVKPIMTDEGELCLNLRM